MSKMMSCFFIVLLLSFFISSRVSATESVLGIVNVIGVKDEGVSLPGSGGYIALGDIRKHSYDDINRVLRKIPGVYLREEDGFGLFPNISLRGVDVGRSRKVTIMEDEILAAPAPYSAPSAYYSPTAGRMNRIEVLKGSSQVKYGPHTTGGVVNYISTPIPEKEEIYLKVLGGTHDEVRIQGSIGKSFVTEYGTFGILAEEYYRQNQGFKTIQSSVGYAGSEDTGFTKTEPMFKVSWESPEDAVRYQKLEAKFGYTDLDANETYLGLSEIDFQNDPYQRYAATRFDNITSNQSRSYLKYSTEISDDLMVKFTGYYNEFKRNWSKLQSAGGEGLSKALAGASGGTPLAILKGETAGDFVVRNNNRNYAQQGYLANINYNFSLGETEHALDVGVGYHYDFVRRFQNEITYTQDATGAITGTAIGAPGSQANRKQESQSVITYVRDSIDFGDWTFTPGVRYESIDYKFQDFKSDSEGASDISVVAGGLGVNYKVNHQTSLFAGIHQGFSVPGPKDNASSGLSEESSLTKEVGVRYQPRSAWNSELVYFHTSFDDLIVKDNIGGGGTGDSENVGSVLSQGIEAKIQYDYGVDKKKKFQNPYYLSLTYTNAVLDGDSKSTDPESIFSGGKDGHKVPYVPHIQFAMGTGVEYEKWGAFVDGTYVTETFSTASNVSNPLDINGNPDARYGKTDAYFVVDISGHYNINKFAKVVANLHNVGDLEYIVSRHPHGPRPGKPFTATAGIEVKF